MVVLVFAKYIKERIFALLDKQGHAYHWSVLSVFGAVIPYDTPYRVPNMSLFVCCEQRDWLTCLYFYRDPRMTRKIEPPTQSSRFPPHFIILHACGNYQSHRATGAVRRDDATPPLTHTPDPHTLTKKDNLGCQNFT